MVETSAQKTIKNAGSATKFRKRNLFILLFLAIIAIAGSVYFLSSGQKSQDWRKNTAKVERGSIDVRIIATGTIKPLNEIKVSPKSTGSIRSSTSNKAIS